MNPSNATEVYIHPENMIQRPWTYIQKRDSVTMNIYIYIYISFNPGSDTIHVYIRPHQSLFLSGRSRVFTVVAESSFPFFFLLYDHS